MSGVPRYICQLPRSFVMPTVLPSKPSTAVAPSATVLRNASAVSYTHLDVYKRQVLTFYTTPVIYLFFGRLAKRFSRSPETSTDETVTVAQPL